jgi:hypothetical protein
MQLFGYLAEPWKLIPGKDGSKKDYLDGLESKKGFRFRLSVAELSNV